MKDQTIITQYFFDLLIGIWVWGNFLIVLLAVVNLVEALLA